MNQLGRILAATLATIQIAGCALAPPRRAPELAPPSEGAFGIVDLDTEPSGAFVNYTSSHIDPRGSLPPPGMVTPCRLFLPPDQYDFSFRKNPGTRNMRYFDMPLWVDAGWEDRIKVELTGDKWDHFVLAALGSAALLLWGPVFVMILADTKSNDTAWKVAGATTLSLSLGAFLWGVFDWPPDGGVISRQKAPLKPVAPPAPEPPRP